MTEDSQNSSITSTQSYDDDWEYFVVRNAEEQYSIWPTFKDVPAGWEVVGNPQTKAKCLEYIQEVWTDMRPLSLRKQMESTASI